MTGRDLIMFILENRLEDLTIFEDGNIPGYMTIGQAAEKWNVGEATVSAWIEIGKIHTIVVGNEAYIREDTKSPMEEQDEKVFKESYDRTRKY